MKSSTEYMRMYRHQLFMRVLEHYGKQCECCGETTLCFLTVEHLHNDGAEHRKKFNGGWVAMMLDIIKRDYPDSYTIRCYNCNMGRERNGGICPHQENLWTFPSAHQ